jgi:hypothetical protein
MIDWSKQIPDPPQAQKTACLGILRLPGVPLEWVQATCEEAAPTCIMERFEFPTDEDAIGMFHLTSLWADGCIHSLGVLFRLDDTNMAKGPTVGGSPYFRLLMGFKINKANKWVRHVPDRVLDTIVEFAQEASERTRVGGELSEGTNQGS